MNTIDNSVLGWNKAFQPEFGLPGVVAPYQNWYIDFEMTFYKAGTNTVQKMDTVDLTALDVDGDGNSISEYVTYDKPDAIAYSTLSYLTNAATGVLGQVHECGEDNLLSILIPCVSCGGDGLTNSGPGNDNTCAACDGSGKRFLLCGHAYEGGTGSTVNGPINNFTNIDTAATQVMATYQFFKTSKIKFRYGAKSAAYSSNGSGIRLNSTWFRKFSLTPVSVLPLKLTAFDAMLNNSKVQLTWVTNNEINVSHFVVERSTDGIHFSDAGTVFAFGNTSAVSNYALADNISNIASSMIYYRLRSVDLDGKYEFSQVRVIRISKQADNTITLLTYPNPASNEVRITIPANWQNKKIVYELFSANGQAARKIETSSSSQTETISLSNLKTGLYVVKVTCEGVTVQQKIIKQ